MPKYISNYVSDIAIVERFILPKIFLENPTFTRRVKLKVQNVLPLRAPFHDFENSCDSADYNRKYHSNKNDDDCSIITRGRN